MTLRTSCSPPRRGVLKLALLLGASALVLPGAARGEPVPATAAQAEALIRRTVDRVFAVLRDAELAKDRRGRMRRLREVVDEVFDWVTMARSSLGHHWRQLTEAERAEFVSVFKELLAQRYMDDVDRFRGDEQVEVRGSRVAGDLVTVNTLLITSSRERVPMDYVLESPSGTLRVIDFAIEGVSLVNHYRGTFNRFLLNRSIADLIAQLKRKLGLS